MSPKKYVVLAKIEVTQFTDPVPTGAANAVLCENLRYTPISVQNESRNLQRAYFGNSENLLVSEEAVVEFDVEVAGSGTAGTAPPYAPLLRACGFAETLVAVTSAAYNPVSSAFESITLYINRDGRLGKMTGARGNVSIDFAAKKIPHYHFRFVGKYLPITDTALPTAVYTAYQQPKAAIPANTGTLTVDGFAAKVASFNVDVANEVSHALWINLETLDITDRKPKGRISIQSVPIATKDFFALVRAGTLCVYTHTHGTTAGNIVKIDAPKVQFPSVSEGTFENNMTDDLDMTLNPNNGNDELIITCT